MNSKHSVKTLRGPILALACSMLFVVVVGCGDAKVSHPESGEIEVFVRHCDGSVQPAGTSTVEAYKKQMSAVSEFFEEMFDKNATSTNLDDRIIEERIRATQKKIQDAEKEKNN